MSRLLKQSTAKIFRIGPFLDSTDGVSAEAGLTIAQADIQISKDGGAFAQTSDAAPTTTHDADGWYQCPLTATDTNTLGPLTVQIVMTGALPVWEHFMVVSANVYDSLIGGSDKLQVHADEITAGLITAAAIATDAIDADALAADAIAEINATVDTAISDAALATAAALATVDGNVDAILDDTGTNGVVVAAASKTGYSLSAAGIQAIWDALTSALTTVGSIGKLLVDNVNAAINSRSSHSAADVWAAATRTLTANTNLNDPTAATIADAVWDEAKAGHVAAGSFGEEIQAHALSSEVSALNDPTAAAIRAEIDSNSTQLAAIVADTNELQGDWTDGGRLDLIIDAILADTNELQTDDVPGLIAALNNITAADILTTALTESYAAEGADPTLTQAVLEILQFLTEKAVSSTTVTVKQRDGLATAATYTLDDDTTPTSITRGT